MFNNSKLDWAKIIIGKTIIEGKCTYWEMGTSRGTSRAYIKLIVDDKEYLTATCNVLLTENPERK